MMAGGFTFARRALAALASACAAIAPSAAQEIDAAAVAAYFDSALAVERIEHPIAGAVVAVVRGDELIFSRGYGYADLERRIRVDPARTLFRIASVTKTFTWTAVMQLVEAGKLDLDADVNTYLDFRIPATFTEPITLRHLMAHTAGFEDFVVGVSARRAEELTPLGEYLAQHIPKRVRPSGRLPSYSNYGTALAGYIVQRASGMPFEAFLERRIFAPLGMTSTSARQPPPPRLAQRLAVGYSFAGGRFIPQPYLFDRLSPDGVISSTATDMARFMSAHLGLGGLGGEAGDARILAEPTARKMQSVLLQLDPAVNPILYGFYRSDRNGVQIFGHTGDWNGFHSAMALLPQHSLGVFISFNSESGAAVRGNLVTGFVDRFFPRAARDQPPSVQLGSLADYTGEWTFLRRNHSTFEKLGLLAGVLRITDAGGGELLLDPGGKPSRWVALQKDRFRELNGERRLVFLRDAQGRVVNAVFSSSPTNALEKLDGVHSPALHLKVLGVIGVLALAAVLGYGARVLLRAAARARLPRGHAALGWALAVCIVVLLTALAEGLTGDVSEFEFGAPAYVTVMHVLAWITAALAVVAALLAVRNLLRRAGSAGARWRYALLALAGLVFTAELWYWNLLAFEVFG
jgi:CubicO group peptidase (beta-lactamase class C family)